MHALEDPERDAHGSHRESPGDQRSRQNQKEFTQDKMHSRNWAGENRFHRTALLLARCQVHRGIHATGQAKEYDHVTDYAPESRAAYFFGRSDVLLSDIKRLQCRFWQIPLRKIHLDDLVAILLQVFLDGV